MKLLKTETRTKFPAYSKTAFSVERLDEWASSLLLTEDTKDARAETAAGRVAFMQRMSGAFTDYYRTVDSAPSDLGLAKARNQLQDKFRREIRKGFLEAFNQGSVSRGGPTVQSSAKALELYPAFDDMVDTQARFANQFVSQLSTGDLNKPGRMPIANRLKLYSNAVTAGFNAGAVAAGENGELIFWKLGACDHCVDCPVLAASGPYTKNTLPTLPGQGQTQCRTNCCCFLSFVPGPAEAEAPEDIVNRWVKGPEKVPGFNSPNPDQLAKLRDMENRKNYIRRKISTTPEGPEKMKLIQQRRAMQREVRQFADKSGIRWTPEFSVGEVITGRNITRKGIDDIFLRGIDGTTISRADIGIVDSMVRDSNAALLKSALNYGIRVGGGPVAYGMDLKIR